MEYARGPVGSGRKCFIPVNSPEREKHSLRRAVVNRILAYEGLRGRLNEWLINQAVKATSGWWYRLENGVLPDNSPNCIFPRRVCEGLGMILNELIDLVEMAFATKFNQGISDDIFPGGILRSTAHGPA